MEGIKLKEELCLERENLIWTLNVIRREPIFINEEIEFLKYKIKQLDSILSVLGD